MTAKGPLASVLLSVLLTGPAVAQVQSSAPTIAGVPVIGSILDHSEELGLSAEQVTALERLATDFMRATIRGQADLALARVDLEGLLGGDPEQAVDLRSTEAKLRELERIRTDLDHALIRAVESARAELTAAQRSRFLTLMMGESPVQSGTPAAGPPTAAADPPDPPTPGGAARAPAPRPSGPPPGRVSPRGPAGRPPPSFPHRPAIHSRFVFGFWSPFWWEPYWWHYPAAPVIVQPPSSTYIPAPASTYWYYCSSAGAYYPYVVTCPEAWIVVSPTPQ